ncbi:MAG: YncE family protein, partial [Panacagrimonas sp.]
MSPHLKPIVLVAMLTTLSGCQRTEDNSPNPPPTPEVPAAIPTVAPAPAQNAAPSAGLAYVSNQEGAISVIDLATLQTVGEIPTGASSPRGIAVSEDGKLLITANRDQGNVSLIDRESGKLERQVEIGKNPEFVR